MHVLKGHDSGVWMWSVASGSHDKTVRTWNASTGEEVHVLKGHDDWVRFSSVYPIGVIAGTLNADGLAVLEGPS